MTSDQTNRQATSPNSRNLDSAGETVNEREVVARPSARKRRSWSRKILGVIGLVAAATVFAPPCAVSGSEMPNVASPDDVKELRPETIQALMEDTGADALYVVVVSANAPVVVGKRRGLKEIQFDNQIELWKSQGGVHLRKVELATFIEYRRNPDVYCYFYTSAGSMHEICFEI